MLSFIIWFSDPREFPCLYWLGNFFLKINVKKLFYSQYVYIFVPAIKRNTKSNIMKTQKQTVKIFGQVVTVGTKLHAKLVEKKKQFDDLNTYETK